MPIDYQAIFRGDWRTLPSHCGGNIEVMDQTVGCPECGQNLWYMPNTELALELREKGDLVGDTYLNGMWPTGLDLIPKWCPDRIMNQAKACYLDPNAKWDYEPYMELLSLVHPFMFEDAHDHGDEDDGADWPAQALLLTAMTRDKFGDGSTG